MIYEPRRSEKQTTVRGANGKNSMGFEKGMREKYELDNGKR